MEKETSCINAIAILDYLKHHDVDYSGIVGDLSPEIDSLEDPESFLRDPNNWISCNVISKLYERATSILHDEKAAYKMGRWATENLSLGYAQRIVVKAFWSHKKALQQCQKINDQFNRNKKVELYELKENEATLRLHWDPNMGSTKYICQYNQGVYTSLPLIWGGRRLTLTEKCCQFDGAPYCEYHVKWPFRNKLHEIVSRFFTSKSVLRDIIKEMEEDKKTIEEKTEKLSKMNKELHNEIAERKEMEKALRENRTDLDKAQRIAHVGIWSRDPKTERSRWSDEMYRILGFSPGSPEEPTREDFFSRVHPADKERVTALLKDLEEKKCPFVFEFRTIPIGGSTRILRERGHVECDEEGRPVRIFGTAQDITEWRRLQAQLLEAQKMEAICTLTGGIAHDYNNLMSIVLGNLSMANEEVEVGSFVADCLNEAEQASYKVRDLTHELMSLSRGGAPVTEVGSLKTLLKNASILVPAGGNISLKESIAHDLWPVSHDRHKMGAVFRNVVTNAMEAMPGGGVIEIRAENVRIAHETPDSDPPLQPGDYVCISIRDQGVGIPEEQLERIFDPYFSTKAMGVQKGMGLGLATSYAIVRKHGGHIIINSSHGTGTTVTIYLPAETQPIETDGKTDSRSESIPPVKRVLVMDDEEMLRKLARQMLERMGYAVETVKDGVEAIKAYQKQKDRGESFDAVILDLTIKGGMGGEQTIGKLLRIDPHVKAIVNSGYFNDPIMSDFRKYGFMGAMAKPYEKKVLEEALENLLSH